MTAWHEWRRAPAAEFGVIGDPIAHTWSPRLHRAAFRALGFSFDYAAIRVPVAEFSEAITWLIRLGYRGLNVTLPLKQAAFAWADRIDEASFPFGAINTVSLGDGRGTNTDGPGFLDMLRVLGVDSGKALILGAGGTARTLAICLSQAGYDVSIWNRTFARAEELAAQVGSRARTLPHPNASGHTLVINATSASVSVQPLNVNWDGVASEATAIDAAYALEATPFLVDAASHGLRTADGRLMLAAQAARSFAWWHGTEPPFAIMRAVIDP